MKKKYNKKKKDKHKHSKRTSDDEQEIPDGRTNIFSNSEIENQKEILEKNCDLNDIYINEDQMQNPEIISELDESK